MVNSDERTERQTASVERYRTEKIWAEMKLDYNLKIYTDLFSILLFTKHRQLLENTALHLRVSVRRLRQNITASKRSFNHTPELL